MSIVTSRSILIVDDDPDFRTLVGEILKSRGLEVIEASCGSDANNILRNTNPIMAIVDYRLPEIDGMTWITSLREAGRAMPLVFISRVWCDAKTFNWLRNILKVSLILQKPIQPELFLQQIESLLPTPIVQELKVINQNKPENNLDPAKMLMASSPIDEDNKLLLNQINDLRSKLERQNKLAEVKSNYAQGLSQSWEKLSAAIKTAHKEPKNAYLINEAKQIAHRLAGTAGSVGYAKIGEAAERIEDLLKNLDPSDTIQEIIWAEILQTLEDGEISVRNGVRTSGALTQEVETLAASQILLYGNKNEYKYIAAKTLNTMPPVHLEIADSLSSIMQTAKRTNFDAIILDLSMDNIENICELAANIRLLPGYRALPIGFIHQDSKTPKPAESILAGCSVLIPKPLQKTDIEQACKKLLSVAQIHKPRVLIVDDDEVLTKFIVSILGEEGFTVSILNNAIDIMNAVDSFQPDLVLLDVIMPGLSGYDICRKLRSHEQWKHLAIVFLTARNDQEGRAAAYHAGGNDFLSKPVLTQELIARVKSQIEQARQKNLIPNRDPLKGAMDCRDFMLTANKLSNECKKKDLPMTICLITLDDFVNFGIMHGMMSTQEAMSTLEKLLYTHFRAEDLRGRLGEDTFVLAFPGVRQPIIAEAINKLLLEYSTIKFSSHSVGHFKASFSAGICEYPTEAKNLQNLLNIAHQKLWQAKRLHPGTIAGGEILQS